MMVHKPRRKSTKEDHNTSQVVPSTRDRENSKAISGNNKGETMHWDATDEH